MVVVDGGGDDIIMVVVLVLIVVVLMMMTILATEVYVPVFDLHFVSRVCDRTYSPTVGTSKWTQV